MGYHHDEGFLYPSPMEAKKTRSNSKCKRFIIIPSELCVSETSCFQHFQALYQKMEAEKIMLKIKATQTSSANKKFTKKYYDYWWSKQKRKESVIHEKIWNLFIARLNKKITGQSFRLSKNKVALDIGCGSGENAAGISEYASHVTGIDISGNAIDSAIEKFGHLKNVRFTESSFEDFSGSGFDIIYLFEIIEHIYDFENKFEKIVKLLKKNGQVVITTPNRRNIFSRLRKKTHTSLFVDSVTVDPGHVNYYNVKDLAEIFKKNSIRIIYKREYPFFWNEHMFVMGQKQKL